MHWMSQRFRHDAIPIYLCVLMLVFGVFASLGSATELETPTGRVILTVTGAISSTNAVAASRPWAPTEADDTISARSATMDAILLESILPASTRVSSHARDRGTGKIKVLREGGDERCDQRDGGWE